MNNTELEKEKCKKKLRIMFGDEEKVKVIPIERGAYIYDNKAIMGFYIKHMCPTKLFPNAKIRVYLKLNIYTTTSNFGFTTWKIADLDYAIQEYISIQNMKTTLLPYLPSTKAGYFDILKEFDIDTIAWAYIELYGSMIRKILIKMLYGYNCKQIPQYDLILQNLQKDIRVAINKGKDIVEDTKGVLEEWRKKEDVPLIFNENIMMALDEKNPESFISGLKNEIQTGGKKKAMFIIEKNDFFEGKWYDGYQVTENRLSNEQKVPLKDSEKDPFLV